VRLLHKVKLFMNGQTLEWVKKAEEDFSTIEQLFIEGKRLPLAVVCFHAQQCIEKYLKAYLIERNLPFDKIHNLVTLIDQILPVMPEWDIRRDAMGVLTNFAVLSRYPDEVTINRKITQDAVDITLEMRELIRTELHIQ
jgi:HEPN domain-containing protein